MKLSIHFEFIRWVKPDVGLEEKEDYIMTYVLCKNNLINTVDIFQYNIPVGIPPAPTKED